MWGHCSIEEPNYHPLKRLICLFLNKNLVHSNSLTLWNTVFKTHLTDDKWNYTHLYGFFSESGGKFVGMLNPAYLSFRNSAFCLTRILWPYSILKVDYPSRPVKYQRKLCYVRLWGYFFSGRINESIPIVTPQHDLSWVGNDKVIVWKLLGHFKETYIYRTLFWIN